MGRLERDLERWTGANIITSVQAEAILAFEQRKRGVSLFAAAIVILGVFSIGTGIVALVASNWEQISDATKLSTFFSLWALIGVATWMRKEKPLVREGGMTLFALLMFAGIGLIAQIYHLSGPPWRPIVFWSGATMLITLASRNHFLPIIWLLCATWGVISLVHSELPKPESGYLIGVLLSLWALAVPFSNRESWGSQELRTSWHGMALLLLILGMASAAQFHWLGSHDFNVRNGFIGASGILVLVCLIQWVTRPQNWRSETVVIGVAAIVSLLCAGKWLDKSQMIGAVLFALPLSAGCYHSYKMNCIHWFRACTAVIGLRFFVVYFEVFGSFATTGVGLVVAGLLLIAGVYFWRSYNTKIHTQES